MNETLSRVREARPIVGQFRNLTLAAVRQTHGMIATLSNEVSRELVEVWLLPPMMTTFPILAVIQAGGIEDLVKHCKDDAFLKEHILRKLKLFLSLAPCDAEWSFTAARLKEGYMISSIIGHPSAMKIARDHGCLH